MVKNKVPGPSQRAIVRINVHAEACKEFVNFMLGLYRNDYNVIPSTYCIKSAFSLPFYLNTTRNPFIFDFLFKLC